MNSTGSAFDKSGLPFFVHRHSGKPRQSDAGGKGMLNPSGQNYLYINQTITYPWNTHLILITYVDVLNGDLQIINDFRGQRGPESLLLRRFV